MRRLLHLTNRERHPVEQRGLAFRPRSQYLLLDLPQVMREREHQLRPVAELDEKSLVLWIRRFEELDHPLPRHRHVAAHTAAGIEHDADRKRRILTAERR